MNYKAHLYFNIGNGKLIPTKTQCGRKLYAAGKGSFLVKSTAFKSLYIESPEIVCEKCLQWAKDNGKI